MKKLVLLFTIVLLALNAANAQKGKGKRPAPKRQTTTKKATTKKSNTRNEDAPVAAAAPPAADSIPIRGGLESMENDNIYERLLQKQRTPLTYEHIREDDVLYKQRVWRVIDTREKMNQSFVYDGEEASGNQRFISIVLNGIQTGKIKAIYSSVDDRFTTPIDKAGIISGLVGTPTVQQVPDWANDPSGRTLKDTLITDEFNVDNVTKFEIKEEWVFDKESSRMFVRILGIAPLVPVINKSTGDVIAEKKLFWLYYPKIRDYLATQDAYNGKNHGARATWEELFESRMFSSFIVKSTLDNPRDVYLDRIPGLKENGILRLWEGENIKNKIFDYEQNLWSY